MDRGVDDDDETQQPDAAVLEGKLANVKWLVDALSCIYSPAHKGQDVTITVHSEGGLRFSVEHTAVLQASVIVPKIAFSTFNNVDENVRLRLNLSLMMECLNLFAMGSISSGGGTSGGGGGGGGGGMDGGGGGGSTAGGGSSGGLTGPVSAHLWFVGEGHPLCIRLWDGDAQTECKLTTLAFDDDEEGIVVDENRGPNANPHDLEALGMGFYEHDVLSSIVIDSELLRDAINDLDYCSATTAEIRISNSQPHFLLCSPADSIESQYNGSGSDPLCTVQLPNPDDRSLDAFHSFQCTRNQCSVYKLAHLRRCKQALALSQTCKLQMNAEGMLSLVCKMRSVDADRALGVGLERCFVEFVIVAQEIDEDEDEEEEDGGNQVANVPNQNVDEEEDEDEDEDFENENDRLNTQAASHKRGNARRSTLKNNRVHHGRLDRGHIEDEDDDEDFEDDEEVAGTPENDY